MEPLQLDTLAFAIKQRLDAEIDPPTQRGQLSSAFGEYMLKVKAEGREPFTFYLQDRAQKESRVRGLFASPDVPGLPDGYTGPDVQAHRQRTALTAYLSNLSGRSTRDTAALLPALRDTWAKKELGKPAITDGEFFSVLSERFKAEDEAANAGATAALTSNDRLAAAKGEKPEWHKQAKEAFGRSFDAVAAKLQPHRSMMTRLMGALESNDEAGIAEARNQILDMPEAERDTVLRALVAQAQGAGDKVDKSGVEGWIQQAGQAGGRFLIGMTGNSAETINGIRSTPEAGKIVTSLKEIKAPEDARKFVTESMASDMANKGGAPGEAGAIKTGNEITLTAAASKLVKEAKERALREVTVSAQLRGIAEEADPIKSLTASAIGTSAAAVALAGLTRGASLPLMAKGYANIEYDKLLTQYPDMKPEDREFISNLSGAGQSAMDLIGFKALDKLPGLKSLLGQGVTKTLVKRFGGRMLGTQLVETSVEVGQDYMTPVIQSTLAALSHDVPGVDWSKEVPFWKDVGNNFLAMIPLTLLGVGFGTVKEYAGVQQMLSNNDALGMAGISEADRIKIIDLATDGQPQAAANALQDAWGRRSLEVAKEFNAKVEVRGTEVERAQDIAVQRGIMPRVQRDESGWKVTDNEGNVVTVETREKAVELASSSMSEQETKRLDAITEAFDAVAANGDVLEFDDTKVRTLRAGEPDVLGQWNEEEAVQAAIAQGVLNGMSEEEARNTTFAVLGSNKVERTERVRDGVAVVSHVGKTELSAGANVLTAIEEPVHANWTRGLREKRWTQEEGLGWVRLAERVTGEKFLPQSDAETLSQPEGRSLGEAIAALVIADTVGRRKDGSRVLSGAVSRGLAAEMQNAKAADKGAVGKFRQFLRAWREYFAQVFSRARSLSKARKEGKLGGGFDAFMDQLLGADPQVRHETAVTKEVTALVGSEIGGVAAPAFSLAPVRRLDFVGNRLQIMLGSQPEDAQRFAERASANLRNLRARWADLPEPMPKADLDKRQARIVEQRREELEEEFTAKVERDTGGIAYMPELAKLTEHPLADLLRTDASRRKRYYAWRLESPSKWRKRQVEEFGKPGGDYDGADGLPSIWFQGQGRGAAPDLIAQEAFEAGLIKEPTPDALWDGIASMLSGLASNRERIRRAQDQLKDARKRAKEEAEYEGRAWRAERDAEQARLGSPRVAAMRDIAAIEAVTLALPAEVRAKLPTGLSGLAELSTDAAFAKEVNRRILAVGNALTKHWKAKNRESLNDLLARGQGKREGGKKPQGTATPAVHQYFAYVAKVEGMTADELIGERAKVESGREAAAGSKSELDWIEKGQILDAWGGFGTMHVQAQSEQLALGWDFFRTGRREWLAKETLRLQAQRENSAKLVEQVGQGLYEKLGKGQSIGGTLASFEVELRDFEGVLSALLGREHELVKRWAGEVSQGYFRKEDAMRALRHRWQNALDAPMPGLSKRKQRLRLYEMRTKQTITVGVKEEKANPLLTAEDKKQLAESGVFPETLDSTVKLTEDQAIFLTMTARQSQYVEPLALAGFTPPVIAQIEAGLTPEAKSLREWMAQEYDEGHTPLSRVLEEMNGIKLPKIPNYSPGRFYNWGNEKPLDVMGTGTVAGGFASGFLMDRKAHFSQVKLASALGVFWTHNHESIHWQNLAPIVREMRGTLRNPDVKRAIEGAWGESGNQLLESWMLAIEGNGLRHNAGAFDKAITWATSQFAVGKLAYNAGTIVKQSMAVLNTSLDDVPFGLWLMGAGEVMRHPARFLDIYRSPAIQRRLENGFTPEVRMVLDKFWTSKPGHSQAALEKGMEILGYADAFFTAMSGAVAYEANARLAERAGMTAAQAHLVGMEKMEEAIGRTAQPQTANRRSIFEHRQSGLAKMGILFITEARQKTAIWLEAWRHVIKGKATARDVKNLLISHLIMGPLMAGVSATIRDWRDGPDDPDDDPAWELWDFVLAAVMGPMQGIPVLGQFYGAVSDAIAGRHYMSKSSNVLADPLSGLVLGAGDLLTDAFDDKNQTAEQEAAKVLKIMSAVGGAPGVGANIVKQGADAVDQISGK